MAKKRGHPAGPAVLRLMKVVLMLHDAGVRGVRTDVLAAEFGYQSADAIKRDLRQLQLLGWSVESLPDPYGGKKAYYRLLPVDTRLAARFEPEERAQLHRVLLLLGRGGLRRRIPAGIAALPADGLQVAAPPAAEGLDVLFEALRDHCLLKFTYSGKKRRVHPVRVIAKPAGYFLIGVEDGAGDSKEFALLRMSDLRAGRPGTAKLFDPQEYRTTDAIHWPRHDPEEFWLDIAPDYHPDIRALLGEPIRTEGHRLWFRVSNRQAARARVYEMLDKVVAVGPQGFRDYLAADIAATVGEVRLVRRHG